MDVNTAIGKVMAGAGGDSNHEVIDLNVDVLKKDAQDSHAVLFTTSESEINAELRM